MQINGSAHATPHASIRRNKPGYSKRITYSCAECGELVDKRELRDVIIHETNHKPNPRIPRIIGNASERGAFINSCFPGNEDHRSQTNSRWLEGLRIARSRAGVCWARQSAAGNRLCQDAPRITGAKSGYRKRFCRVGPETAQAISISVQADFPLSSWLPIGRCERLSVALAPNQLT